MATTKNKLRVQSSTEYIIEVNDLGETISFDVADTSLPSRLFKMLEDVDRLKADYDRQEKEIANRADVTLHTIGEGEEVTQLTQNQHDMAQLIDEFYNNARTVLDTFLGNGACRKIFGDKNYLNMFDDLLFQLQPHLEKMGLNTERMKKAAVEKYKPNRQQRRALQ